MYEVWRQKLPRVKPFYLIKCNSDENVVKLLAELGVGVCFDCSSIEEFKLVFKYGVASDRIIYAHPYKAISHICYAAANNISVMNFDSIQELSLFQEDSPCLSGSSFELGVTVHSKKEYLDADGNVSHVKYIINDGIHGSFNIIRYDIPLRPCYALARKASDRKTEVQAVNCSLMSPSCNDLNKLSEKMILPLFEIGDVIVFPNMRAYTLCLASTFNGFMKPTIMYF
uniref:Orn/DAP/Arg decarboxylase 2 N-terminal domain-containing protein n=1 Tax=Phlebotomus papatasi TaxID=29031 RepID=A0A1B0DHB4_PHLPP